MVTQLVKKFPAFHGIPRLITLFTTTHHWTLFQWTHFFKSTLTLSSYQHLGFPSGLFPSNFLTKILYAFLNSPMCATHPVNHIFLDLLTLIAADEEYKLWSSSLCSLLQPPATSSLLGPIILLITLFTNTLNLCSSLKAKDQDFTPIQCVTTLIRTWYMLHMKHNVVHNWLYNIHFGYVIISK